MIVSSAAESGGCFALSVNQTDSFFFPYSQSAEITAAVWPPRRAQREPLTPGHSENLRLSLSTLTLPAASQSFCFLKSRSACRCFISRQRLCL